MQEESELASIGLKLDQQHYTAQSQGLSLKIISSFTADVTYRVDQTLTHIGMSPLSLNSNSMSALDIPRARYPDDKGCRIRQS